MHPIRASRRPAWIVPWLGSVVLVSLAAALAASRPRPPGWNKHPPVPASARPALRFPPGWNKHPPLPAHAHTLATSGFPGWQLTLMAATVAMLATAAAIGYLGPGCTADARTLRRSGDRIRRRFDRRGQLRRQRPHRASRQAALAFRRTVPPGRDGSHKRGDQPARAHSCDGDAPAARDDRAAAGTAHHPAMHSLPPEPSRVLGQPH